MGKSSSSTSNDSGRKNCYRGHWRPAEDEKLRGLVERYGPQNWNFIAEHLDGRSGKSCRLRWYNQLDPNINKKPFTEEEEERLLSAHRIYGNKWACIAKYFQGRTDNAVKNHYHVVMARRKTERFTQSYRHHSNPNNATSHRSISSVIGPKLGFPKLQSSGHHKLEVFSAPTSSSSNLPASWSSIGTTINYEPRGSTGRLDHGTEVKSQTLNILPLHGGFNDHRIFISPETLKDKINPGFGVSISGTNETDQETTSKSNLVRVKYLGMGDSSKEHREVPFIDFLGVGINYL